MQTRDLFPRHGEHAERIIVAQVVFDREWKFGEIGQIVEIRWMDCRPRRNLAR